MPTTENDNEILERLKCIEKKLDIVMEMELPSCWGSVLEGIEKHISKCSKFKKIIIDRGSTTVSVYCSCKDPTSAWVVTSDTFPSPAHKKIFDEKIDELNKKYFLIQDTANKKEDVSNATEGLEI